MEQSRSSSAQSWLNRTVLGIALPSLFSDWSHEIATAVLPAFLGSLGVAAAWDKAIAFRQMHLNPPQ
jgi:hypothetical protein